MATTDQNEKPARRKPGVRNRKAAAAKAAATRAANKAAKENGNDQASAPAAKPAAKPAAPAMRDLGTFAVIDESNERGKIIGRAEYLHMGGTVQYQLAYTRADGCYDERWFAAGQLVDYVERRKGR